MPPNEQTPAGIKWHEVTWYSKLGAMILLPGVVPALCFYIGMQYELVQEISLQPVQVTQAQPIANSVSDSSASTVMPVTATVTTSNNFKFGFWNPDSSSGVKPNTSLSIENLNTENKAIDLTGWTLESKSTGLFYTIPKVTTVTGYKGSQPATVPVQDVMVWPDTALHIMQMGTPDDNNVHQTEATTYSLYTGAATWDTSHDTLTIKDAKGKLIGQLIYGAKISFNDQFSKLVNGSLSNFYSYNDGLYVCDCKEAMCGSVANMCSVVVDGDVSTFKGGIGISGQWSKDKNNVYCGESIVAGADPATLKEIANPVMQNGQYIEVQDKNHSYNSACQRVN